MTEICHNPRENNLARDKKKICKRIQYTTYSTTCTHNIAHNFKIIGVSETMK